MDTGKVFNDPIHGHIELPKKCVQIIDTPEFQRLRFIKQLGTCSFVYPGATHTRFEHALGTCHLAGKLMRTLKEKQKDLNITDEDVLSVEIAGLCHDLGHGPFAHIFDKKFIPKTRTDKHDWKYPEASEKMFEHILKKHELQRKHPALSDQAIMVIKQLIKGQKTQDKPFLCKIIANTETGIDVCKWDYLARDCFMLGLSNNFDSGRCMHFAKVLKVVKYTNSGQPIDDQEICYRDKERDTLIDMFHTRYLLHKRAYQHKTKNIIDMMITDALLKADDHFYIPGTTTKMSKAIDDMEAYSRLTDNVFFEILYSDKPELEESRKLLGRVLKRDTYKHVAQTQIKFNERYTSSGDEDKIKKDVLKLVKGNTNRINENDCIVDLVGLDYGNDHRNPVEKVRFFSKWNPEETFTFEEHKEISYMLPERFCEQLVRIAYKADNEDAWKLVRGAFHEWCKQNKYPQPAPQFPMPPAERSPTTSDTENGVREKHVSTESDATTSEERSPTTSDSEDGVHVKDEYAESDATTPDERDTSSQSKATTHE